MKRRRFIVKAGGALAAAGIEAVVEAPSVIAQPKVQWRMSTAWARSLDVQRIAEQFAKVVEEMSGGRFQIEVFAGGPVDLRRTLDHATAAMQVYGLTTFHAKNATALERLKAEFKGKVEVVQTPVPVLRDLKKLAAEVIKEESEKTPMARKVHASFTKFQALVGPWDRVAEGAYHQLVAG